MQSFIQGGKDANSHCDLRISEILEQPGSPLSRPELLHVIPGFAPLRPGSVSAGEQTRVACCSCACLCCMFAPCVPLSLSPAAVINCCMVELLPFWNNMKWTDLTSIRCICFYWHFAFFSNQTAIRFDLVSAVQVVWCVMFSLGTSCKTLFKTKNFDIDRNIKRIWQFLNMNQKHRKLHIHSAN